MKKPPICCENLLILPLGVADGLLPDLVGKNPFFYLLLFVYGYLLVASEHLQVAVDRRRWRSPC